MRIGKPILTDDFFYISACRFFKTSDHICYLSIIILIFTNRSNARFHCPVSVSKYLPAHCYIMTQEPSPDSSSQILHIFILPHTATTSYTYAANFSPTYSYFSSQHPSYMAIWYTPADNPRCIMRGATISQLLCFCWSIHFNPRPSCEERLRPKLPEPYRYYFNPRPSCEERQSKTFNAPYASIFQSTLLMRGATFI